MIDFIQTIWIPIGITGIAYSYMMYQYQFAVIEPEANPKFTTPLIGILVVWTIYAALWLLLIFVEHVINPFIEWFSCACSLF